MQSDYSGDYTHNFSDFNLITICWLMDSMIHGAYFDVFWTFWEMEVESWKLESELTKLYSLSDKLFVQLEEG